MGDSGEKVEVNRSRVGESVKTLAWGGGVMWEREWRES